MANYTGDVVILLHGLARTRWSMERLARALSATGYTAINIGYPSRRQPIDVLSRQALSSPLHRCRDARSISFVTHSMGGILVRDYLKAAAIPQLHRVVMLGPPNRGSEIVDHLGPIPGFKLINGEAGLALGTGADSVPNRLGTVDFDLGVIAGTRKFDPVLSRLIDGPNDGKVAVERTKIEGMRDHITLPVTHTFMMRNPAVIHQVIHYLDHGVFDHQRATATAQDV